MDICGAITESPDPGAYWRKLKQRLVKETGQPVTFCHGLKIIAPDGKMRETDCANTEGVLRIIQAIPSPKVKPLKRWLAKVGYERILEIEDQELATKRTRLLYKLKGYPDEWIEMCMRGIAIREELNEEWKNRGAEHERDYEILTAEISKATFGITPSQYKSKKGLGRENLRDHMDDFDLILTMLGERTTKEIHKTKDSKGMRNLKDDAMVDGAIAGSARSPIERRIGRSVISDKNFLKESQNRKILKKNKK